ncbi:hypothetical protein Lesp02_10280 [Lentzea sp. NBRC 105346]|uniref:hypothetical protein n=1 Tax=Lentzea sp. NBRC 105346 TaxID=3032205 RepID=UPI0024A50100|nr:hypothetical protein [Lentzea sp. NBRC 105346]GLZ28838.1 hypothetical protein Lesp02_10280 [Lentzea sp. NBRC 105346]
METLSHRAIAMLRAVAAGRAELTRSCEPDLRVDHLCCCDQSVTRLLVALGLVAPKCEGPVGTWVPAQLTPAGMHALAA